MLLPYTKKLRLSFFTVVLVLSVAAAFSQSIKGRVTDAKTGEPLTGALVYIKKDNTQINTAVKLDGSYLFKNVSSGIYTLRVKFIGYKTTKDYSVDVKQGNTSILNIAMADNSTELTEVAITEHTSRESDRHARSDVKNANNTMNVVSANSIAISPDVLISNVLSRVSGISVDRGNTGDAQHVIIRGMDKKYNTTLINGVKIPSPDNKNRFVPLDIFPADLVERIEVSKTLTPDMEGDASGGVVNLIMKTAPDRLRIEGNFGTGYSQLFFDRPFASFNSSTVNSKAPGEFLPPLAYASINSFPYQNLVTTTGNPPPNVNANITLGNRFFNKKLGVIFSGTFQNSYVGNNTFYMPQSGDAGPAPDANSQMVATGFQDAYTRKYSSKLDRTGLISSIDYKFNQNNSINLFGTFIQLNEHRVRQTQDANFGGYAYNGYRAPFTVDYLTETRTDLQDIYSAILKGDHKLSNAFKVDWTLSTSEARHQLPDVAEFDTKQGVRGIGTPQVVHRPGGGPADYVSVYPALAYSDTTLVKNESRLWRRNTDNDISGYLNLHYDTKIWGRKALLGFGGMFRHKTRNNFNDSYRLDIVPNINNNNDERYISIPQSKFQFNPLDDARGSSFSDAGVYTFYENVQGAYGQLKYWFSNKLDVIFGLRAESTLQHFEDSGNPALGGNYGTISYTDYLPSINLKYALTDIQALRLSYYQSVLRPAYADVIPFVDLTQEGISTTGNPNLQHTVIDNYDLRYEAFPGVVDEFMLSAFYKYLSNPIEFQYTKTAGTNYVVEPANSPDAHNFGFEAVVKKFFGNIGISANYTYTNSKISSTKVYWVTGFAIGSATQVRPLQGQSANVGNFSLLYKNAKNGLDAQLALAYTGERINAVSQYKDLDIWEKATLNLDFSAQKEFKRRYIFYVKVNNLLNTPYELFVKQANSANYDGVFKLPQQNSPNYTTVEYDKFYTRYSLGFRFKF